MPSLPSKSSTPRKGWTAVQVPTPNPIFETIPSKDELKEKYRPVFEQYCAVCGKSNTADKALKVLKCGKCKDIWYCSQKCQLIDWPQHKTSCVQIADSGIDRLVKKFWTHRFLRGYLEVYSIIVFDLLNPNRPGNPLNLPLLLRIDIGLEPADITSFMEMFYDQKKLTGSIPGMFQVNAITHSDNVYALEYFSRRPRRGAQWVEEEVDDRLKSKNGLPVVHMEFIYRGEVENSLTVVSSLSKEAMELAREQSPYLKKSAIRGTIEMPFGADSTIQALNGIIRDDKQDKLLLRAFMGRKDVEIIRAAGRNDNDYSRAVQYLLAKTRSDSIYTPIAFDLSSLLGSILGPDVPS
ncbi:hypothetical protein BDP27DRAFT_1316676 [Rhodocollybia butyracea]|uniref:MYND-type domain-containing protein n=1 Tax=Rhodocollybia butyracea TaxID=206335 RepID=A0A9P5Q4M1_9AGAR|nr:hypothetical protein BDP27DRAFT_1316676 [Rhodocollybia butyracea]